MYSTPSSGIYKRFALNEYFIIIIIIIIRAIAAATAALLNSNSPGGVFHHFTYHDAVEIIDDFAQSISRILIIIINIIII